MAIFWDSLIIPNQSEINIKHIQELRTKLDDIDSFIGQVKNDVVEPGIIPLNGVIIWEEETMPKYGVWAVCNGSNGTRDMRRRFPIAAGENIPFGTMGGEATTKITLDNFPVHTHRTATKIIYPEIYWTHNYYINKVEPHNPGTWSVATSGEGVPHNNIPPYYASAYLKRIG